MDEDIELSSQECDQCGHHTTHMRDCWNCGGAGYHDDLYEADPLWYSPGDTEPCDVCDGKGTLHWCPKCGADIDTQSDIEDDLDEYDLTDHQ